jgi:hypothetical protein
MISKMLKRSSRVVLILVAACAIQGYAQRLTGTVCGTAVDQRGIPVSGVIVGVVPLGHPLSYEAPFATTDARGYFSLGRLQWGTYRVFAMKPGAGYPNTNYSSFYGNGQSRQVTIAPTAPTAKTIVHLGPKAGVLAGSVEDADTGAPVNANFKLTLAASPGDWLSTSQSSAYRVLLPQGRRVLIQVSAPGYETWGPLGPLRLKSGEEKDLDIHLEPSRNPNLPTSEFLIPDGYVGWVLVDCNVKNTSPTPVVNGARQFKLPERTVLLTSSDIPAEASPKRYLYYTKTGSTKDTLTDYRHGHGMVWGAAYGTVHGVLSEFHFFVGTESEYKKQGYRGLQSPPAGRQ